MIGAIGFRVSNLTSNSNAARQAAIPFSTSAPFGGGGGRGGSRGRVNGGGIGPPSISDKIDSSSRVIGKPSSEESEPDSRALSSTSPALGSAASNGRGQGRGQGRGMPLPPPPPCSDKVAPIHSFLNALRSSSTGRGRVSPDPNAAPGLNASRVDAAAGSGVRGKSEVEGVVSDISSILGIKVSAGRGKPVQPKEASVTHENRHLRRPPGEPVQRVPDGTKISFVEEAEGEKKPKMSKEDAVKHALQTLSKMREDGGRGREAPRRRDGAGGDAVQGRKTKFRPEKFDKGRRFRKDEEEEDEDDSEGHYLGDNADDEKLAKKLGPEKMKQLTEIFEEIGERVLPSPEYDAFLDAYDVNCAIEFEPEYLMEFDTNPDIDEKPPIPLRDALEKMKPFLMAYEGIESHEEWEAIVKDTMEKVPLLKEIVDHYSGPDRVTAKRQNEELERVAKTLPESAPSSVKRFADRAVLSLQSNPGWGFDRKCQFMDKLVWEVSRHYK